MATQATRGAAFEYSVIIKAVEILNTQHHNQITTDFTQGDGLKKFNSLSKNEQNKMSNAASKLIRRLYTLEPWLKNNNNLTVEHVKTVSGTYDVVDVYLHSGENKVGISCKSNHDASRHSRVSPSIDVANIWLGLDTNYEYMDNINNIFADFRDYCKKNNIELYSQLTAKQKDDILYSPITQAFENLLKQSIENNPEALRHMIYYLIGNTDFYKAIANFKNKILTIKSFNLRGDLNTGEILPLPTECLKIARPMGSQSKSHNYIQINCDNNWCIKMRIHNARSKIENSLKWDVQLESIPSNIFIDDIPF